MLSHHDSCGDLIRSYPPNLDEATMTPKVNFRTGNGDLTDGEIEALRRISFWKGDEALRSEPGRYFPGDLAAIILASITADMAATLLGISSCEVARRVQDRTLLAIADPAGLKIPTVQFHDGALIPGIETVLPTLLAQMPPHSAAWWLARPNSELPPMVDDDVLTPESPRAYLLRTSDIGLVAEIAAYPPRCI